MPPSQQPPAPSPESQPAQATQVFAPLPVDPSSTQAFAPAPPQQPYVAPRRRGGLGTGALVALVCGACALVLVAVGAFALGRGSAPTAVAPATFAAATTGSEDAGDAATDAAQTPDATTAEAPATTEAPSQGFMDGRHTAYLYDGSGTVELRVSSDGFILPQATVTRYSDEELESLTTEELWVARNEIHARHGKGFRTESLARYFDGCGWYVELYTADEYDRLPEQLNENEQANYEAMLKIEKARGSSHV